MIDLKTRILIVDDMPTMRKLMIKACKDLGFNDFIEAADGTKAWEALGATSPPIGLIISDFEMPNCNGIDLLKRIRSDGRFKALPFVLVVTGAEKAQVDRAKQIGVTNCLLKPFSVETLKVALGG